MSKIVFIGFATCYKSSVGKLVAARLDLPFYDTDELIEQAEGATVRQIFDTKGEAYFRKCESKLLAELSKRCDCVIACGGGTALVEGFDKFAADCVVVWLTVTAETVLARLGGTPRPLFDGLGFAELSQFVSQRSVTYESYANFELATDRLTSEQAAQHVLTWLREHTSIRN